MPIWPSRKKLGDALEFIGKIGSGLKSDEVDIFLNSGPGRALIDKTKNQAGILVLGKSGWAKRKLRRDMLAIGNEQLGDAFVDALGDAIKQLPYRIVETGILIKDSGVPRLVQEPDLQSVIAVPRSMVYRRFESFMLMQFRDNQHLSNLAKYEGFVENFLNQKAAWAEREFFKSLSDMIAVEGMYYVLLDGDAGTEWDRKDLKGHYYLAEYIHGLHDLKKKEVRTKILEKLNPKKQSLSMTIGNMSKDDFKATLQKLESINVDYIEA